MSIDLQDPITITRHATRAVEKQAHAESRRVRAATRNRRRGRKAVVALLVVVGGATVVAALARRIHQVGAEPTTPDAFGYPARRSESVHEPDGNAVTTA